MDKVTAHDLTIGRIRMTTATEAKTITTHLRPIDRNGLLAFAEKGRNNPGTRGTNKVHTVTDGQYRTVSHVNGHEVVVDEPLQAEGSPPLLPTTLILISNRASSCCRKSLAAELIPTKSIGVH